MTSWYSKVASDLSNIPDFITHYENELVAARSEVKIFGKIEQNLSQLPGITEERFRQLQEVEGVLNYLNIKLGQLRQKHFKKYLEGYQRSLSAREAEKYVDGEEEVVDFSLIINEVALLRNKWLAIIKGLESKNYMIGHIRNLRTAGMEDASV